MRSSKVASAPGAAISQGCVGKSGAGPLRASATRARQVERVQRLVPAHSRRIEGAGALAPSSIFATPRLGTCCESRTPLSRAPRPAPSSAVERSKARNARRSMRGPACLRSSTTRCARAEPRERRPGRTAIAPERPTVGASYGTLRSRCHSSTQSGKPRTSFAASAHASRLNFNELMPRLPRLEPQADRRVAGVVPARAAASSAPRVGRPFRGRPRGGGRGIAESSERGARSLPLCAAPSKSLPGICRPLPNRRCSTRPRRHRSGRARSGRGSSSG